MNSEFSFQKGLFEMRPAEVIALVSLFALVIISISGGVLIKKLNDHQNDSDLQDSRVLSILKENVSSQRMMTCIMSISQERRELEYRDPNSFCHQMANVVR